MKKSLKLLSVLFVLVAVFMTSCDKDVANLPVENNSIKVRSISDLSGTVDSTVCYEFVYPFKMQNEKGKEFTVNSVQELKDLFATEKIYDFVYPYQMKIIETGEIVTINKASDIDDLLTGCGSTGGVVEGNVNAFRLAYIVENADSLGCYNFKYPMDVTVEEAGESKVLTLHTSVEFLNLANSSDIIFIDFVYPFTLIRMEDGLEVVINKKEDIAATIGDCTTYSGGSENGAEGQMIYIVENADSLGCYNFKYPLDVLLKDGNGTKSVTLTSTKEFLELMNSEINIFEGFVYPFTLVRMSDGVEVVINKKEDIAATIGDCGTYSEGESNNEGAAFAMAYVVENADSLGCYNFKYPLQYIAKDGDGEKIITLSSYSDFLTFMKSDEIILDVVYPFVLIKMDDESEVVINKAEDIEEALHSCSTYTPGSEE